MLEARVGQPLFLRGRSPQQPTPLAEAHAVQGRAILAASRKAFEAVQGYRKGTKGIVRIGGVPFFMDATISRMIADFQNDELNVTVQQSGGNCPTCRPRWKRGRWSLGLSKTLIARIRCPCWRGAGDRRMLRGRLEFFRCGSPRDLVPDAPVRARIDRGLDPSGLHDGVAEVDAPGVGRPASDPGAAVRLMLAGILPGIGEDRRLMRAARVNRAIRGLAGLGLNDRLPDHSSPTRTGSAGAPSGSDASSSAGCRPASRPASRRARSCLSTPR